MLLVLLVSWGCFCFRPPMRRPLARTATRTQYKGGMRSFALLFEDVRDNCLLGMPRHP